MSREDGPTRFKSDENPYAFFAILKIFSVFSLFFQRCRQDSVSGILLTAGMQDLRKNQDTDSAGTGRPL